MSTLDEQRREEVEHLLMTLRLDLTEVALAQEAGKNTDRYVGKIFEALRDYDGEVVASALVRALWDRHRLPYVARALAAEVQSCGPQADELPLTCPAPEAHAREARRTKPLWWLRFAGLLDGDAPDGAVCAICAKPFPRSHRRTR